MHNVSNHEVDGLQQQKTTTAVATSSAKNRKLSSPKFTIRRLENHYLV